MTDVPHCIIPLAEVSEGKLHECSIGSREIVLCPTKNGMFAVDNICTHAYARLNEGRLRGTRLICPLHGAAFDVRDGKALGPPATQPLITHTVAVLQDVVKISLHPAPPR